MIRYIKVIFVCCTLFGSIHSIQLPSTPCPNVFAYEGDSDPDRWHGVITFSSNIELVGMNYKVQLDRPSQLLVSWDGDVRTEDNINYNVFDPYHTQRAGEIVKARIMVKFNPNKGVPGITRIVINGNTMCSSKERNPGSGYGIGLSSESTTRGFDPPFNEGELDERDPPSDVSNNRGPSPNHNYGGGGSGGGGGGGGVNSPNYNENTLGYDTRPNVNNNRPSYEPAYSGGGGGGSSNSNPIRQAPNYGNTGTTSPPLVYVVNPINTPANVNSGPYNGNGGSYSGSSGYNNNNNNGGGGEYSNENRPQWSATPAPSTGGGGYNNKNNNNNNGGGGFSNGGQLAGSAQDVNGPIVTTLTLPNGSAQNKTNIDQIVQIIKNQLEQQQISSSSNKTFIVAVVNPMADSSVSQYNANANGNANGNGNGYSNGNANGNGYGNANGNGYGNANGNGYGNANGNGYGNANGTTTDSSVIYRTTTPMPATTITAKAKIVVSTTKSSSSNGHTSRPKD